MKMFMSTLHASRYIWNFKGEHLKQGVFNRKCWRYRRWD